MDTCISTKYKKGDLVSFLWRAGYPACSEYGIITNIDTSNNKPIYELVSVTFQRESLAGDLYEEFTFKHLKVPENYIKQKVISEDCYSENIFLNTYEDMLPFLVDFIHFLRGKRYLSQKIAMGVK